MEASDFLNIIKPKLKSAYGQFGIFGTEAAVDMWFESLKPYPLRDVDAAVMNYIRSNRFKPTPSEIINLLPAPEFRLEDRVDLTPRYETVVNSYGKEIRVRTYHCIKCKDTGLITWVDDKGIVTGRPCNCAAGHLNFKWGWMTPEEQKESFTKNGIGADRIGENWY